MTPAPRSPLPPGPPAHPLLGHLPAIRGDALGWMRHTHTAYGDAFRARLGPRDVLIVAHPAYAREVLVTQAASFRKGRGIQKMREFLGDGLLTAEGDSWRRHRRLMQPAFHRAAIAGMAGQIVAATQPTLRALEHGAASSGPVELSGEMLRVTLRAVAAVLFGAALNEDDLNTVERDLPPLLERTVSRTRALVDLPLPTPRAWRDRAAAEALDGVVGRIIRGRRAALEQGQEEGAERDLLGLLLTAQGEDGAPGLNDRELRDEVMTLFLAGHETTANLLTFLLLSLARHPEWQARVRDEVRGVLGGAEPDAESAHRLPLLSACIQETLRLYPPAWIVPRQSTAPVRVAGYDLPTGANVSVNIFLMQRHARFWPEPERFRPERWLTGERVPEAFMPFGLGARMCIGNHLALLEAHLIAALILRDFGVEVPGGGPQDLAPSVTLRPAGPVLARVRRVGAS